LPRTMNDDRSALEREATYFHALFFSRQIPDVVVRRYVAANVLCFPAPDTRDCKMVETIVAHRLDAEAIELAMRLRHGNDVLTRKIQILFFLVEVRSAYYGYFVNQTPGLWRAVIRLLASSVQTAWKGAKGCYLVWRYGFV
jgi:hypothetical protein